MHRRAGCRMSAASMQIDALSENSTTSAQPVSVKSVPATMLTMGGVVPPAMPMTRVTAMGATCAGSARARPDLDALRTDRLPAGGRAERLAGRFVLRGWAGLWRFCRDCVG